MPTAEQQRRYDIALNWLEQRFKSVLPTISVLDIGCHDGSLARQLAQRGATVSGIDVYEPQLAATEPWRYTQQNLNNNPTLPYADGSFSAVTALEIIEHIIDTDHFIDEVGRVLRPGGVFMISTPNINMLRNRVRVPLGLYPFGLEWRTLVHHVRLYNVATLREHLESRGFHVTLCRGTHLVPQRWLEVRPLAAISERLSWWFPQLASNLMVCAEKRLVR